MNERSGCSAARVMVGSLAAVMVLAGCIGHDESAPRNADRPMPLALRPRPAPAGRPSLRSEVLPSGLRFILEEDPYATVVGVVSVVRGGSGLDPAGREGLAHLVEHLTFRAVDPARGSDRPATRWNQLTRYAVADMNAFTTPDCLIFYEFAPPARLRELFQLEAARLSEPLVGVDEEAFALERDVVGSEHLVRADARAGAWAATQLFPLLFPPEHPYSRSTGGTDESRRSLTLADARAFAARSFAAEQMTVLVTAPPGVTSLEGLVAALPPALRGRADHPIARTERPAPPVLAGSPAPAATTGEALVVTRRASPLPTPQLWLAWTLPGNFGDLGPTEGVLQHWVQEDLRLDQLAQEDRHILNVDAWLQPGLDASVLFVQTLVADGADPERVAQVVAGRVASLWARETSAREGFALLRSTLETERMLGEPGQVRRAVQMAVQAALGQRAPTPGAALASMQSVPSSAVAHFAYQHLTRERAHATMFTPSHGAARHAATPARHAPPSMALTELVPGAASWDLSELSDFLPPPPEIATTQLSTGLTVITVRRKRASAVAWLGFRGGYSDANPPLLVELALRTRPEAHQATRLHMLPARGATRDLSFEAVEFLPTQLPDALALLFAKATVPVKEWPAREGLERLLAPVVATEDGPAKRAGRAFWHALFGDHPYARAVSGDDLDKLTRSDVDAWVGRVHNLRNAALVVIGDVTPAEVERGAAILSKQAQSPTWVADLPAPQAPIARPATGERLVPVVTARPGGLTDIQIGCLLPPLTAAERGHYELLKNAIEARLNTALRIDDGDSYGVNVAYERLRGGTTYLVASTWVSDEILSRTLAVLHAHWRRWARQGFEPGELNVARWRYAGELSSSYGNANTLALQMLADWNSEPAAVRTARPVPDIAGLRASRVDQLFATCKANAVLGLTGNEPAIQRALEQSWPDAGEPRRQGP